MAGLAIAAMVWGFTFLMTVDWIRQNAHHPETR